MGKLSHLDALEAEAIYIIREVAAESEKPVMLYSIGKDSTVMMHLALKAFYPEKPPFPFLHINTTWKFHEMIAFRDAQAKKYGLDMIERDEEGNRVLPEQKEGLSEDEVDDLVAEISFKSTDVGDWFVDYNKPSARLVDLLHLVPERTDTYIELLEFVEAAPRPYGQIEELLLGSSALQTVIDGRVETMQPSVFVDKLERAGALVWKEGWTLTEEGREFLEDLKVNGQA